MLGTSKSVWGFDPRSVPGCQLWLDGADPAGTGTLPANGATVSTWVDKSGNSNNATGGTSPTYSTSGKGLVFSTASTTYLQTPITAVPTAETVFCVFTPTNAQLLSNNDMFSSSATNGLGFQIAGNGTSFALKYDIWGIAGYAFTSYTIFPGTIALGSGTFSSSTATTFLNGGASVGGPTSTASPSGSGTRRVGSGAGGDYFNGTIHELIYYNSLISTSQRQQIEGYLAHKWGLTGYYDSSIPLSIPGCALWLDAADSSTITLSTTKVTQWNDKSGNGYNFTQSTSGNQPTYSTSSLNGLNTITFTSANSTHLLGTASTNFIGTNSLSMYGVFKTNDRNSGASVFAKSLYGSAEGRILFGYRDPGTPGTIIGGIGGQFANVFAAISDTYTAGAWRTFGFVSDRSGWTNTTYQNGTSIGTATVAANTTTNLTNAFPMLVGAYNNSSGGVYSPQPGYYLDGGVGELLVFSTALTTTQRQTIEGYLAKKWGIGSSSIPSIHPFSSIRPHLRTFQPSDVPGCQLWLDGADQSSMTLSGSSVTQWNDKSGNGANGTAVGTTPTIASGGGITFSAGAYNTSYSSSLTNESLFVVFGYTRTSGTLSLVGQTGDGARLLSLGAGASTAQLQSSVYNVALGALSLTTTVPINTIGLGELITTNSTMAIFYNGTSVGTPTAVTITSGRTSIIGGASSGGSINASQYFGGIIYEVIGFTSALTTTQRQQVEGYLAHKWGLTPSLPVISPLSIPGCQLWLDGADPAASGVVPANGATVSTWVDKSGNGRNATVAPSRIVGTYSTSFRAVNFATSNTGYITNYSASPTNETMFVVFNNPSASPYNFILIGGVQGARSLGAGSSAGGAGTSVGNLNTQIAWLARTGAGTYTAGTTALVTSQFTTSTNSISLNGGTAVSDGAPGFTAGRVTYLGVDATDASYYYQGYAMEILFYNSVLTTSQRQQIEGYLARKWGISISATLPSPHPFRSFPPAIAAHFFPTNISGCALWLDADDALNFTGSTWNDKSGTNNHAVNGTPGITSMPTVTTWSNGRRAARFVRASKNSIKTTNVIPIYVTYFIVARVQGTVTDFGFIMVNNVDGQRQVRTNSTSFPVTVFFFTQTGGTDMVFGTFSQGQEFMFSGTVTSGSAIAYGNGVQRGTSGVNNSTPSRHYFGSGDGDNNYLSVDIAEVLIYDSVLTTSQRQQVEGYLAWKWGLKASLPSKHPFKPLPPIFPPAIIYNLITATGGTIVEGDDSTYHIFTSSSNFVVTRAGTVNYLIVGGGGGGGDRHGGGGGAGGVLSGTWSASAGTYTVTVGLGGAGGSYQQRTGGQNPQGAGFKGGDSSLSGTGISQTAFGGGGGGTFGGNPSGTFGSGGGGGGGAGAAGIAGTAGQGNSGGAGSSSTVAGGGGGGAGGVGVSAEVGTGGIGASAYSSRLLAAGYGTTFAVATSPNTVISGGVAYIAGGGGGGPADGPGPGGAGGLGGGGRGDWDAVYISTGTPNTGGGGGASRSLVEPSDGVAGGSGLVLLWY